MWQIKAVRALGRIKRASSVFGLTDQPFVNCAARYFRERWFSQFFDGPEDSVATTLHGIHLVIPKQFIYHYVNEEYEPLTRVSFVKWLRTGMVVVDVGAHIGYYSLLAAKAVGGGGKVHSIEPFKESTDFFSKSIALNQFKNIKIHPCAAGRRCETRTFNITGSSDSHGFYHHPLTDTVRTIEIRQMTLDELVEGRVDAVKIDVEGAELEVFDGMEKMLAKNSRLLLWVEWFPAAMRGAGYDPLDLPKRLGDLGFNQIQVMADRQKRVYSLNEAIGLVGSGKLSEAWYANIFASRY